MDIQNNMNSQSNVSYLRIRPCDNDNEIYLNSRKKEGTSSFLIKDKLNFHEINRKGFQTISNNISHQSSMWIINDDNWEKFMKVDSRRVIYFYKGNKEIALEVLTRLKPRIIQLSNFDDMAFIKIGRASCRERV